MAFPWLKADGFETGNTTFTATSGSLLSFPHYTELARQGMAPYRGAYCARIRLAGGTTSQYVREDTAFDLSASGSLFVRWYFYLGKDLVMATNDKFSMFEAESTLDTTTEVAAGVLYDGTNYSFWINETQAAASPSTFTLGSGSAALGKWYSAEVKMVIDSGAPNDGTIDAWINDTALTQVASLNQAAIVDAKIGVIGPDAGTSGTILIDDVFADDGQIYRNKYQYRHINAHITQVNDHPIIGPGRFSVAITDTNAGSTISLYDSDGVPTNLAPFAVMTVVTAKDYTPGHDVFEVQNGLYTVLTGTAPQAFISIERAGCVSDATMISQGLKNGAPKP